MITDEERRKRFDAFVLNGIEPLKRRGYNPTRFLELIAEAGTPTEATRRMLSDRRGTSYGFQRLYELGELARSVEFAAVLPWFRDLFTAAQLDMAGYRLTEHGFPLASTLESWSAHTPESAV